MKQAVNFAVLAAACLLGLTSTVSAQELITWEASVPMFQGETVQTFVNTNGTLAYAANMNQDADPLARIVTLNGVDFTTTNLADLATITGPGGVTMSTTMPSETGSSYGDGSFNADVDIFNVIATGIFGPGDVSLAGLTPGRTYEIQIFVNDSRFSRSVNYLALFSDGVNALTIPAAGSAKHSNRELIPPSPPMGEPSGDSVTGSFVAGDGGTQTFSVNGSTDGGATLENAGRAQINAIQVRDVTDADVPSSCDVNLDGSVNFEDISPFIAALSSPTFLPSADCNGDGEVNFSDIAPFIAALAGG